MSNSEPARTVSFSFTEEQALFREIVGKFARDKSPSSEVRRLMESTQGFDDQIWRTLSEELGLAAITIPECYGGSGFGPIELGIVMEELGRVLFCTPYLSSCVLGTSAILYSGSEADKAELLPRLASGETRAALALTEQNGRWDLSAIELVATSDGGDAYKLNGSKRFVVDGHTADLLIVAARLPGTSSEEGVGLFVLDANTSGVNRRLVESMDSTRKLADIEFRDALALPLGTPGETSARALTQTLNLAAVALANEMVGGAQHLLDSSVAYANMRVQFGRTIGSFQAIKHKCADMLLDVEGAKSAAYYAAQALAAGDAEAAALTSLAKAAASDTYLRTAAAAIQIHGGIGFTWENDTQLWFKRAKSSEVFLGSPEYHRELLMQRWGY